jgi:hypothetical protein
VQSVSAGCDAVLNFGTAAGLNTCAFTLKVNGVARGAFEWPLTGARSGVKFGMQRTYRSTVFCDNFNQYFFII